VTIGIDLDHTNPGAHCSYRDALRAMTKLGITLERTSPTLLAIRCATEPEPQVLDILKAYRQELLDLAGLDWWTGDIVVLGPGDAQ